jgi:hypothetical protein
MYRDRPGELPICVLHLDGWTAAIAGVPRGIANDPMTADVAMADRIDQTATRPAAAQLIVMENSFSLKAPRSSVTRTVKMNVPAVVGVPEMVFSRLGSSRPGGNAPATTDQV